LKRICLLSDTHGYVDDRLLDHVKQADEAWHAGDFGDGVSDRIASIRPLRGVYGNIDGSRIRSEFPEHITFTIDGLVILMIHIAGPFGSYNPAVRDLIGKIKPGLLVCGHSHLLKVQFDSKNRLLYMNPGAAGKHGFHKVRTLLRFTIDSGRVSDLEAVELGLRGAIPSE
jgi:putative phosphoesterase